jgi:dipeptidyl aminopeptidase/acylaminoacyl peptidase
MALRVFAGLAPAVVVGLLVLMSRMPGRLPQGPILQVAGSRAFEGEPSLSPDGQWLAFRCDGRGNADICVSTAEGRQVRNLTSGSADDESEPAFSPDGSTIAYRSGRGGIGLVARGGGPMRPLTSVGRAPAWSPSGTSIVYVVEVPAGPDPRAAASEGWRVDLATGYKTRIAPPDFREPAVSPGGGRIAFVGRPLESRSRRRFSNVSGDLWTMSLDGGEPVRVTDNAAAESSPMWSPDGRFLFYVSNRSGSSAIWRIQISERTGRTRGQPEPVRTPFSQPVHLTRSADGRRLAWSDSRRVDRVMRVVFDADARRIRGVPAEVTAGDPDWESAGGDAVDLNREAGVPARRASAPVLPPGVSFPGHWSPDRTLFAGTAGGSVWIYHLETKRYEQLRPGANPVWLNDSRRVAYAHDGRLFLADALLKISRELFSMPDQHLGSPRLSRDNLHLYFTNAGVDANIWIMNVR